MIMHFVAHNSGNKRRVVARNAQRDVLSKIYAIVKTLMRGRNVADIDDICGDVYASFLRCAAVHGSQARTLDSLLFTIAKRRITDRLRQESRIMHEELLDPCDLDTLGQRHSVTIDEEHIERIKVAVRRAANQSDQPHLDSKLVSLWLASLDNDVSRPIRSIGRDIWPHRPQTACERLLKVLHRARLDLEQTDDVGW